MGPRGVVFLLVGCPIVITVDAWRFSVRAWRVAGSRRWLWKTLPILLLGIAFLPFGPWWFRSLVLAADASCVGYAVKVRPTLRLAGILDDDVQPDHHGAAGSITRIEAHPADRSLKSRMKSSLDLYRFLADSDRRQPRVVAVNGRGEERVLFVKATWEEALEARDRVHDDLRRLGLDQWRRLYGVPSDFLN